MNAFVEAVHGVQASIVGAGNYYDQGRAILDVPWVVAEEPDTDWIVNPWQTFGPGIWDPKIVSDPTHLLPVFSVQTSIVRWVTPY